MTCSPIPNVTVKKEPQFGEDRVGFNLKVQLISIAEDAVVHTVVVISWMIRCLQILHFHECCVQQ